MFWQPKQPLNPKAELFLYRRALRICTVGAVLFLLLNVYYLIADIKSGLYWAPHGIYNAFAVIGLIVGSLMIIAVMLICRKKNRPMLMRNVLMLYYVIILLSVAILTYTTHARALDAGATKEYMGIAISAFYLMLIYTAPMPKVRDSLVLLGVMVINTVWLSSAYGNEYFHLFKQASYRAVLVIGYIYMRKIAIDYANDSSALEEANKLLENYSYTDQLTGAWNRHALEMHHNQALDENVKEPFGYIMLDVDDFKAYNDQYSHNRGDEVLEDVAKALMVVLGENAKLYRFGGEEFLIVVRKCTEKNLVQIACQCREEIKSASAHMEDGKFITASFGCTMCTLQETDSLRDIVLMADTQLHIAKENGKDCVVFKDHVYR